VINCYAGTPPYVVCEPVSIVIAPGCRYGPGFNRGCSRPGIAVRVRERGNYGTRRVAVEDVRELTGVVVDERGAIATLAKNCRAPMNSPPPSSCVS
jgi:hypothetical protein